MPQASTLGSPTLRQIASQAGVSHTTVALSLRNHPSIPEPTRERVRRIADELGYRSNVLVSALMTQVRHRLHKSAPEVVAYLTGGPTAEEWRTHSACLGFYEGARRRAQQLGMRVEPFWLGPGGANAGSVCRMLKARAIRGTLIAPFPLAVYRHELDWDSLICVGLGYVFHQHAMHRATHYHFRAAFLAYETLIGLGYRRIGLIIDRDQNRRVRFNWLGGYLAAQASFGGKHLAPLLTSPEDELTLTSEWMNGERPDAVIGFGPRQFQTLKELGYAIPRQVAFAALDVEQTRLAHLEEVSGINQNLPLVGASAIDMLAGLLYHNEQGLPKDPVCSMIEGYWVSGRTAPRLQAPHSRSKNMSPQKTIRPRRPSKKGLRA